MISVCIYVASRTSVRTPSRVPVTSRRTVTNGLTQAPVVTNPVAAPAVPAVASRTSVRTQSRAPVTSRRTVTNGLTQSPVVTNPVAAPAVPAVASRTSIRTPSRVPVTGRRTVTNGLTQSPVPVAAPAVSAVASRTAARTPSQVPVTGRRNASSGLTQPPVIICTSTAPALPTVASNTSGPTLPRVPVTGRRTDSNGLTQARIHSRTAVCAARRPTSSAVATTGVLNGTNGARTSVGANGFGPSVFGGGSSVTRPSVSGGSSVRTRTSSRSSSIAVPVAVQGTTSLQENVVDERRAELSTKRSTPVGSGVLPTNVAVARPRAMRTPAHVPRAVQESVASDVAPPKTSCRFSLERLCLEGKPATRYSPLVGGSGLPACMESSVMEQVDSRLETIASHLGLRFGSHSCQGDRRYQEDRYVESMEELNGRHVGFFGVYDGHEGDIVSSFLSRNLHKNLWKRLSKAYGNAATGTVEHDEASNVDLSKKLAESFAVVDRAIFDKELRGGSTAICGLVHESDLVIGCLGDSQAVVSRRGKVHFVSEPHKPSNSDEKSRIEGAGGRVSNDRVLGMLGVSRAFGDNDYKCTKGKREGYNGSSDLVSAIPTITRHSITKDDDFMVLASDGLFDMMTPEDVVAFVAQKRCSVLKHEGSGTCTGTCSCTCSNVDVTSIAEALVSEALSRGSSDNVTATVVFFHQDSL